MPASMPTRHGGRFTNRPAIRVRETFSRRTIAPFSSRPIICSVFLPVSIPMVRATAVSALLGMACPPRALQKPPTDSACRWGREHGRSIPLAEKSLIEILQCGSLVGLRVLVGWQRGASHWKHLRTTNVIESSFATVRHRTVRSKGCLSNRTALAMIFKLAEAAEKSWRRLDGHSQLPKVIFGVKFTDGIEVVTSQAQAAAA